MEISLDCQKLKYGGGMERYAIDLINGFHQLDIAPYLYSTKFDTQLTEYKYIKPIKVNLSFIPKPLRKIFYPYAFNKRINKDALSFTTIFTIADVVICGGNHIGYLRTINKKAGIIDRIKILNEKRSLSKAKLIIAHSKFMRNELIELYGLDKDKIKVVYPPVNTERFILSSLEVRDKLREKFGFSKSDIIYLFPSTGHDRKGFDILKNYFENTDLPIKLVVAGTQVASSKNITSLGFCNNMPELYQAADYTIMASKYEPFGLVGIESILSGTQIIFSDNMGCLEILKNNFGYKFSREKYEELDLVIQSSVDKALLNQHRIQNPLNCIDYDPCLMMHVKNILPK